MSDAIRSCTFPPLKSSRLFFLSIFLLVRIMEPQKGIVFLNNQGNEIENFTSKLIYHGIKAAGIHGTSRKMDRKKSLEDFRGGKVQLLIASDIAARGLQIEGITHIFNVNIPENVRDYVHRVGRSGRNGNTGTAVSIATERELQFIRKFEKSLNISISPKDMYKGVIIDAKKYINYNLS
jgi:superfamily II DNA/RNA helicase